MASSPPNKTCLVLTAGCGFIVLLLEGMELLRRNLEGRSGLVLDTSDVISANVRLAYIMLLFITAGLTMLARTSGVPSAQTLEPAFAVLGLTSMVAGVYFASCKSRPRKPKEVLSLKLG